MHLFLDPSQSLWILFFLESLRGGKDCLTRRPEILLSPGSVSGHGKLNHDLGLCPVMGELSPLSYFIQFSSVQLLSRVRLFATPWTAARQASLFITNSWSLIKLMSIESAMPPNHLILCHPLLLPPSIFPSIRVFSSELVLHIRWPKDWSFSFSISPSNKHSGLISFRIDWLDLLAVHGTLKSLLQPQLKSNNSSMLSLLYGPTHTSIHDSWKKNSFNYMDLCQ